jgi:hypothetical protein
VRCALVAGLWLIAPHAWGAGVEVPPARRASFEWYAEFLTFNAQGATFTAKARIEPHVATYVAKFKPGEHIVMVWTQFDGNADAITYVAAEKEMAAQSGYLLRGTFIAADPSGRELTFATMAPPGAVQVLGSARAGTPIRVAARVVTTTPWAGHGSAVALNVKAPPRPQPVAPPPVVEDARPVAGKWALNSDLMGNPVKLACEFTQTGRKLAGACHGPGPLRDLTVSGAIDGDNVNFQFGISQGGVDLTLLHRGTLDAPGTTIRGTLNLMGNDAPFTATKQ